MLIMGFGPRKPKDLGAVAPARCPNCTNDVTFRLLEVRNWFSVFFIPVVPGRAQHAVVCPVCQHGIRVEGEALERARSLARVAAHPPTDGADRDAYRREVDAFWSMLGGLRVAADPRATPEAPAPGAPAPDPATATPDPPAGWYADPFGESEQRYWDGRQWTAGTNPPVFRS